MIAEGFSEFWAAYPRKVAKEDARRAWEKLAPPPILREMIAVAIARQRETLQWTKGEGQFIPYPATWINGQRWHDEGEGTFIRLALRPGCEKCGRDVVLGDERVCEACWTVVGRIREGLKMTTKPWKGDRE